MDSEEKEYEHTEKDGFVKSYRNFTEIPFAELKGSWFILGRVNSTVNELRMLAKDAGLYFKTIKMLSVLILNNGKLLKPGPI